MAEQRNDDLQQSRREAALLLRLDPSNLSPSDALRCDLIATLRLSIDSAQADALEGRAADLGRLIVATESLVKLLPSDPPKPEANHPDPREEMWRIYKQMRERGEIGLKALAPPEDHFQHRINELEAEIAALKAGSAPGSALALPDVPMVVERGPAPAGNVVPLPPKLSSAPVSARTAADPLQYDYNREQDWKDYVEADDTIRSTPRGRGHYWGPV
jgi:hypothetical protein